MKVKSLCCHTLNLYSTVCLLYFNKTRRKKKENETEKWTRDRTFWTDNETRTGQRKWKEKKLISGLNKFVKSNQPIYL